MEFRQLEVFVAVSDLMSFSKAAEYLFLSQSTVSSHLKNLEKELHQELITRSTKSVQLTDAGKRFLFYARRILDTKDSALAALNTPVDTLLHIGASTIPSGYLLPDLLTTYHQTHPHVFFDIKRGDSTDIQNKLLDGTIDIGLIGLKADPSKFSNIPFCSDELAIVTPLTPHYLALAQRNVSIHELLQEPIILRESGSGTQKAADLFFNSIGLSTAQLNTIALNNDLESTKQMIINGMGISILSSLAIEDLKRQGQVLVFPVDSDIRRTFYITYLNNRELKPVHLEFIDFTRNFFL